MSSTASLLAGLVKGFTEEKTRVAKEALDQSKTQQHNMLEYLGHLASSPGIPAEHQQWAMGKMQEIINAKPGGKLPKVDLNELPPISTPAGPTRTTSPTLPSMTLQPPVGPGGMSSAAPAPSGDTGRASDSTVNALGNITPPVGPNGQDAIAIPASLDSQGRPMSSIAAPVASVRPGDTGPASVPNSIVGMPDASGRPTLVPNAPPSLNAPISPMTLPAMPQAQVQNPMPPQQISTGGLHVLTPEDKAKFATVDSANQMEKLRQRYPDKSPEELAYFAKHDEFPKDEYNLEPGQTHYKNGKPVATNNAVKPGAKSGYEPVMGPGGPIGVKDVATGGMLSTTQVEANPQAKAVFDQATHEHAAQMAEAEAKDKRHAATQAAQQARAFAEQARMLEARQEALSGTTKTMVEAAPRVLDLSAKVRDEITKQQAELGPLSSRWSEFMSGKVGAPNEEFFKLRTDTRLLQTLLMRMHVGARGGEHMMDHFKEMLDSGKQSPENMTAALDEIDSYAKDVAKEGSSAKEAVAAKAEGREAQSTGQPVTAGASHEVYVDGKLVGHVVDNKYVPIGK